MTLVELLVVMAVIGLVVGMSVPAFTGYTQRVRLKAVTRQTMGLVSLARSVAISSRQAHAVVMDPENGRLSIVNVASGDALEQTVRLPSSVTLEFEVGGAPMPETQVVFRPNGSLGGRAISLVLSDRQRQQTITISGVTGAVTVQ